jgi:hypothetical protein
MRIITQRFTVISVCGLLLLALITIAAFHVPFAALAQQTTGNLQVAPQPDREDTSKSLRTRVVMVSVLKEGAVVKQKETGMSDVPVNFTLPVGVYDVRVEGDEVTTALKRGVHVTQGDSTNLLPQMRSGQGVCECKYSK